MSRFSPEDVVEARGTAKYPLGGTPSLGAPPGPFLETHTIIIEPGTAVVKARKRKGLCSRNLDTFFCLQASVL